MSGASHLVVIGCSWGGLHAVGRVLEALPANFGAAVAIAQHRSADSDGDLLVRVLQARTSLPVREIEDKDAIEDGRIYLAPPDYHVLVEPGTFALSVDERVQYSRPSIDVLFESAADAYGPRLVGVVLTGANEDGAAGLRRIKERGGVAVVQDPGDAEMPAMPAAAIAAAEPDRILPLAEIAADLVRLCEAARVTW